MPATIRGAGEVGHDVTGDGPLVGHPEDGPVGSFARDAQHQGAEGGEQDRRRRDVGDVQRVVDPERVVLHVDGARAGQGRLQHIEVVAHGLCRSFVGQAEHLVDDPVVGDAQAQGQATLEDGLGGECLLGQRDRVPGLDGDHRRADLDARGLESDDGRRREGVELVGDLRHPDRGQPGFLRPAGVGHEPLDLGPVAAALGADHHADAHALGLPVTGENVLLVLE